MLQVFTHANFPLMGRVKWVFIVFSSLAVVVSLATILTRGFNYGIDFAGGTAVRLKFREQPHIERIRSALEGAGLGDISLQSIGEAPDNEVLVRVEQGEGKGGPAAASEGGEISRRVLEGLQSPEDLKERQAGKIDLNMITEADLREWLGAHLPAGGGGAAPGAAPGAPAPGKDPPHPPRVFSSPPELASDPPRTPQAAGP